MQYARGRPVNGLRLKREVDESIIIGGKIVITVSEVRPGKVWLAIEAPAGVAVDRYEVHLSKLNENL